MSINYSTFVQRLMGATGTLKSDVNLTILVPYSIDYAEQRLYRELDLQATEITDTTTLSSGVRTFTLPTTTGTFLVVEQVNVITTSTQTSSNGTRNPLTRVNRSFLDAVYPTASSNQNVPLFYAMTNNTTAIIGPPPDASYQVEIVGTQRPAALSSANSSTILTTMLPDLFLAAAMAGAAQYLSNNGVNIGQMAEKSEAEYKMLFASAQVEELRKRYRSEGWTDKQPSPIATPPRA